jgi:phosphoglycolate phosphatase
MAAHRVSGLVVFDWNGTIVDDLERATRATGVVLATRGRPAFGREEFRDRFRLPLAAFFAELGVDPHDLVSAEAEWNEAMGEREAPLAVGVPETLAALRSRGTRVGVVSAAAEASVLADARACGVDGMFEFVLGSRADKRAALQELVADHRGWVAYVGDTEYDMVSARAADVYAIGYGGGYRPAERLRQAGAATVIDVMSELVPALDRVVGAAQ